jgi:2-polyprenyl-3-methyl-5-hydroxy-6-metoxy-1,4-benzoquinol methylase
MTTNRQKPSRRVTRAEFDQAYDEILLESRFFERDSYYIQQKPRYYHTLQYISRFPFVQPAKILEVGGGQMALLTQKLFGDRCTIADVSDTYKDSILKQGLEFRCCDLVHDDLEEREAYDVVILCEVIEHLPVPPYLILEKIRAWMKPEGLIFITTPNLYRLRNLVRLALGLKVFDTFFMPARGQSIGHPFEYSAEHLKWQIEQAGFQLIDLELKQLDNAGASLATSLGRFIATPFFLRPLWRDKLVAVAKKVK